MTKKRSNEVPSVESRLIRQSNNIVLCPQCNNRMIYLQVCHLRCANCGAELSCEDKGWFWG